MFKINVVIYSKTRFTPPSTDANPTKLFCLVGVGGVNRVGDSFQ